MSGQSSTADQLRSAHQSLMQTDTSPVMSKDADKTKATCAQKMVKKAHSDDKRKCCFNDPGGPWPRNIMLEISQAPSLTDSIITLVVGEDKVTFSWFHKILGFHSTFFASAMALPFEESKTRTIQMPEDDADVVREYMRWITDHRLGGFGEGSDNPTLNKSEYCNTLAGLWVFGNKYGIPRLQNVTVNAFIAHFAFHAVFPTAKVVDTVYDSTQTDAPIRRLLVDIVFSSHENVPALLSEKSQSGEGYSYEFHQDLLARLWQVANAEGGLASQRKTLNDWKKMSTHLYHVSEVKRQWNGHKVG